MHIYIQKRIPCMAQAQANVRHLFLYVYMGMRRKLFYKSVTFQMNLNNGYESEEHYIMVFLVCIYDCFISNFYYPQTLKHHLKSKL